MVDYYYVIALYGIVCSAPWSRELSSFCDFFLLKYDTEHVDLIALFFFFKPFVFQMCLIRSRPTVVYQYPNMINFDAVDFSECRSEEVISVFFYILMLSVYILKHFMTRIMDFDTGMNMQEFLCVCVCGGGGGVDVHSR